MLRMAQVIYSKNDELCIENIRFAFEMMTFVFEMMTFVFEMVHFCIENGACLDQMRMHRAFNGWAQATRRRYVLMCCLSLCIHAEIDRSLPLSASYTHARD